VILNTGVKVGVAAVVVGEAINYLWRVWHPREASPVGWLGWDGENPSLPDGWDRGTDGNGNPTGDFVKNNPDGTTETLHPDLR